MKEQYYAFFKDGSSISKMTVEEAISIPHKEYILKQERSPEYTDKRPVFKHAILNGKGENMFLKFGDWELIDMADDVRGWNGYRHELTYYDHKNQKTYKRRYNGIIEMFFYKDVVEFMKRLSQQGGWQLYEYEEEILNLKNELEKAKKTIDDLYNQIEKLENPDNPA